MINQNKIVIVFSGFNQRAVIAFLRTLDKLEINFAIVAKSNQDTVLLSSYKKDVCWIRENPELDLIEITHILNHIKKQYSVKSILPAPSTEALNRFLLNNRKELEEAGCIIPLVEENLYQIISDKFSFGELCSAEGILVPRLIESPDINSIPFVAKPKKYFTLRGGYAPAPVLINTTENYKDFLETYKDQLNEFYFQEFVDGQSFYLLYYFHRNGSVYKFSQENIVQQPEGKSIVNAVDSDFHLSDESLKYERLLKKNNFSGLIMIEVKKAGDRNFMIEANPRFWGPSQLFVDAGYNFFEALLFDFGFTNHLPEFKVSTDTINYFWFGGIMETYRQNKSLTFHSKDERIIFGELSHLIQLDIYRRHDTMDIFINEIKH